MDRTKRTRSDEQLDWETALFDGTLHDAGIPQMWMRADASSLRIRLTDPDNWDRKDQGEAQIEFLLTFRLVAHFSRTYVSQLEVTERDVLPVDTLERDPRDGLMIFMEARRLTLGEVVELRLLECHRSFESIRISAYRRWQLDIVCKDVEMKRVLLYP